MSRQIGPAKPLNAGGGRNTAQEGCVCVKSACIRARVPFPPVEIYPEHGIKGGDRGCARVGGFGQLM